MWFVGSVVWFRFSIALKKILIDGSDLIISNYSREYRVPLTRLRRIVELRFVSPQTIKLIFDEDVGPGASVIFLPTQKYLWPWQEHPIVKELRRLSDAR